MTIKHLLMLTLLFAGCVSSAPMQRDQDGASTLQAASLEELLEDTLLKRYPSVRVYHDGDGIQIRIRGSREAPLYVVDGVPMAPTASALLGINPEAIEDVSVLKGPAATMLYGSRARNGVVIFTTRRW